MSKNLDLKELWKQQSSAVPDEQEFITKLKTFSRRNFLRMLMTNGMLVLTIPCIILIWNFCKPEMLTTKLGMVLVLAAMVMYVLKTSKLLPLLMKIKYDSSSKECLQRLLAIKEKQRVLHRTVTNIYFLFISVGLGIYLIEYILRMRWPEAVLVYGITFLLIAGHWFYLRPRGMKKQQQAPDALIHSYEALNRQLTTE